MVLVYSLLEALQAQDITCFCELRQRISPVYTSSRSVIVPDTQQHRGLVHCLLTYVAEWHFSLVRDTLKELQGYSRLEKIALVAKVPRSVLFRLQDKSLFLEPI